MTHFHDQYLEIFQHRALVFDLDKCLHQVLGGHINVYSVHTCRKKIFRDISSKKDTASRSLGVIKSITTSIFVNNVYLAILVSTYIFIS